MFKTISRLLKLNKLKKRFKKGITGELILDAFKFVLNLGGLYESEQDIFDNTGTPKKESGEKIISSIHGFTSRLKAQVVNDGTITWKELVKSIEDQLKKDGLY